MPAYLGEEAQAIEVVGTVPEPNFEAIAALEPDLILGTDTAANVRLARTTRRLASSRKVSPVTGGIVPRHRALAPGGPPGRCTVRPPGDTVALLPPGLVVGRGRVDQGQPRVQLSDRLSERQGQTSISGCALVVRRPVLVGDHLARPRAHGAPESPGVTCPRVEDVHDRGAYGHGVVPDLVDLAQQQEIHDVASPIVDGARWP